MRQHWIDGRAAFLSIFLSQGISAPFPYLYTGTKLTAHTMPLCVAHCWASLLQCHYLSDLKSLCFSRRHVTVVSQLHNLWWNLCPISFVFTWMQDDWILRWPPKNKTSAKKKYFTIKFVHLIHKVCQILYTFTNQCHCLHLHLPHTLPNFPILFTAIPQHTIISPIHCIVYTALNKTFCSYICWDVLLCLYDHHWLNSAFMFLGL